MGSVMRLFSLKPCGLGPGGCRLSRGGDIGSEGCRKSGGGGIGSDGRRKSRGGGISSEGRRELGGGGGIGSEGRRPPTNSEELCPLFVLELFAFRGGNGGVAESDVRFILVIFLT